MGKRKSAALINSDDSGSSGSDSDNDKDMLAMLKKGKGKLPMDKIKKEYSSGSDEEWGSKKKKVAKRSRRTASGATASSKGTTSGSESDSFTGASSSANPTSSSFVSSSVRSIKTKPASDLEEGEVSSNDEWEEEFCDGYDENMMGDLEDQQRLNAMTEKEREQEIFRRVEKRDLLRNRFETEKKLRLKKKLEAKMAKKGGTRRLEDLISIEEPSSDALAMDAKMRSQDRKKTVEGKVDKKTQAMDALKSARDAKIQRAQEKEKEKAEKADKGGDDDELDLKKEGDKDKKKLKASDVYSDDSGSDYEDGKGFKGSSKEKRDRSSSSSSSSSDSEDDERSKKTQYVEKLEDLNRIKLSRFRLENWVYLPIFARVVKGCFVRVGVKANSRSTSGQAYKIFEIVDVVEHGKAYEVGKTKTNKVLMLKLPGDSDTKPQRFRIEFVSNQSILESEFEFWKSNMERHNCSLPTFDDIIKKEKEIKEANNYQLQEEDVAQIVIEKAKFKSAPVNFAAKKTQLMKDKEIATMNGEDEKVSELAALIQELDERATILDKVRTSTISSISYINQRNRKRNVEEAEKAILEELKVNKGKKVEDPFTRRTTKPKIVSKPQVVVNGGFDLFKTENGVEVKQEKQDNDNTKGNSTIDELDGSLGNKKSNEDDDDLGGKGQIAIGDLFSAHDFEIKLDLDARLPPNLPIVARPSIAPMIDSAPRRSLNLEEYKRKKGLI